MSSFKLHLFIEALVPLNVFKWMCNYMYNVYKLSTCEINIAIC